MVFQPSISPGTGVPIFRQIVDQVRVAVATGKLRAGEQLPSVRALAERLVVNPNTVAKAYGELSREGIIDGQHGRGVFIAPPRQIYTKSERLRRIMPLIDAVVNEGLALGFSGEEIVLLVDEKLSKLEGSPAARKSS